MIPSEIALTHLFIFSEWYHKLPLRYVNWYLYSWQKDNSIRESYYDTFTILQWYDLRYYILTSIVEISYLYVSLLYLNVSQLTHSMRHCWLAYMKLLAQSILFWYRQTSNHQWLTSFIKKIQQWYCVDTHVLIHVFWKITAAPDAQTIPHRYRKRYKAVEIHHHPI